MPSAEQGGVSLWRWPVASGVTAVVATHDPVLLGFADHVLELRDGALVQEFALPRRASRELQWTPDGITYVRGSSEGANIWTQPLSGQPPRQLGPVLGQVEAYGGADDPGDAVS